MGISDLFDCFATAALDVAIAPNWTSFSGIITLKSYWPRGPSPMPASTIRSLGARRRPGPVRAPE